MLLETDFCLETIKSWKIIGSLILIIKILVPIILILTGIMTLIKAITSSNNIENSLNILIKKIIASIIIFLIPTIINTVINIFINNDTSSFTYCNTCLYKPSSEECTSYIDEYENKLQEEIDNFENIEVQGNVNSNDLNKASKDDSSENTNSNGSNGNGTTYATVSDGSVNIIVGDSRTVGMCSSYGLSWNKCNTTIGLQSGDDLYIAKSGSNYSWFNSTAVNGVNQIINDNPNTRYNIFSLMGVNDLYHINTYISRYNELANNEWSNQNIILVSVTPVDESRSKYAKNSSIQSFNEKLKNGTTGHSNVGYCDVYSAIINNFETRDGLHYISSTYKNIHDIMLSCK